MRCQLNKKATQGLSAGTVVLQPGANEVSDEKWALVAEHLLTKAMIADGTIVITEAPADVAPPDPPPVEELKPKKKRSAEADG